MRARQSLAVVRFALHRRSLAPSALRAR
jgi:hypothetical protein